MSDPYTCPAEWRAVRRILAIRLDNIGDIVMLGPSLRSLRMALPEAKITLMASPAGSQVAPMLPWVDEIIVWRAAWQDVSGNLALDPAREMGLVRMLRKGQFDAAVIFTSFSQSPYPPAYTCYLAGIPIRLGQSKEFGGSLLTQWVKPPADSGHQVDRNLALLEAAGFEAAGRHLELRIPEKAQQDILRILQECGVDPAAPYVLLAPGASCAARRYDPDRFAEAAKILSDQSGLPVVVAGSSREEKTLGPVLAAVNGVSIFSLVGQTSVTELAALVQQASLVIANNSACLHFADAFERPMLILYSGTEYESQWMPRRSAARLLRRPTDCSPCYRFRCPYGMECLDISPKEVANAALELLAGVTPPLRAVEPRPILVNAI